ncbi:signal peptidase I [bacterium]|nr:signal peptidase I [bacterium]
MNDPNDGPVVKKRKPWLAVLLSLLAPGLGQLYNGQWLKALIAAVATMLLLFGGGVLLLGSFAGLLVLLGAIVAWRIAVIADAFVMARMRDACAPKWYNALIVYMAFFMACSIGGVAARWSLIVTHYEMYRVPSETMSPTIMSGDGIVVGKRSVRDIYRNELLVFRSPYDRKALVKRCVAVAGDTVEIRHKQLWVNGENAEGNFAHHTDQQEASMPLDVLLSCPPQIAWERGSFRRDLWRRDNFGPVVVPDGHLFMLGDNRDNSYDSRFWGPVDRTAVIGKPLYIYFSNDIKRIGMTLR